MECWVVVGVLLLLETMGLAWPGPGRRRRGVHRSGRLPGAMRSWPGAGRREEPPEE